MTAIWTRFIFDQTADTSEYGHMLPRYIENALEDLSCVHRKMAFVSGPRQCGKTTLGKMLLKDRGIGAAIPSKTFRTLGVLSAV
jgi:predicted AAA+ superfamily ATPase